MRKLLSLIFLFFTGIIQVNATHNRAGEITYEHLYGYTYRFTIRICTNEGSGIADRPSLDIHYGDGTEDTVPRISETPVPSVGSFNGSENLYVSTHTYQGPYTYYIEVLDPNRNQGVQNITNSVNVAFCLRTTLVISPFFSAGNNSCIPQEFPCPEIGCVNQIYVYNSAAYDPDGDSLSYELVPCMGGNSNDDGCDPLAVPTVYQYPQQVGGGVISIDPSNGTVTWNYPTMVGEFNFAVLIKEWRYGVVLGSVLRDIQVTILGNCTNNPPVIDPLPDTCVVAGASINFPVHAQDPDAGNLVYIEDYGQPFSLGASFSTTTSPPDNPINGNFNWLTDCSDIRNASYQVFFIAKDNDVPAPLVDVTSSNITVIPPAVTALSATPFANTINLHWPSCGCSNIKGYKIYRKFGPGTPTSGCCDANTPVDMGYTLIGTNSNGVNDTNYTDHTPLVLGNEYCYIVVAYMIDGAVSCPSPEACTSLKLDVPIITNVSVGNTDAVSGIDTVRWYFPIELDTVSQWPGPYFYKVYKATGFTGANQLIYTTPMSASLALSQQELIIDTLNTVTHPYNYKIELWHHNTSSGNDTLLGPTNVASSIFLSIAASDNQLALSWAENVPWTNTLYDIYKETPTGSGNYTLLASTDTTIYTDTGLINGHTYCYYVVSTGAYSQAGIPAPLINYSQIVCAQPVDLTPPCPPTLTIDNNCDIPLNTLIWNNPNNSCADDVMSYSVYFTPVQGEPYVLIATFNSQFDTTFQHVLGNGSVAGCYYVTATDSAQYGNESLPSNVVCGDNCPDYTLPNVFSPNNDGNNDLFIPFPYSFVDSIDLHIYDRWGIELFTSSDPDIKWDGKSQLTNKAVPDGVYYYTCTVFTIRVTGLEPVNLHGFIHIYTSTDQQTH